MPRGRPRQYEMEELLEKTEDYILTWVERGEIVPMRCSLALYLGVNKQTISAWCRTEGYEEFSSLVKVIDAQQEQVLVTKGLSKVFDTKISALMLAKHGYAEKQLLEHTGEDGGPVRTQYVITPVKPKELDAGTADTSGDT